MPLFDPCFLFVSELFFLSALFDRVYESLEKTWWLALSPSNRRGSGAYQMIIRHRTQTKKNKKKKKERKNFSMHSTEMGIEPSEERPTGRSPVVFWLSLSQSFARRWAYAKKRYQFALKVLSELHPHYTIPFVREAFEIFFFKMTRGDFTSPERVRSYLGALRWKYAREASEQRDQTLVSRGLFMKNFLLEKPEKDQGETFFKVKPLDDFDDAGMEAALRFRGPAAGGGGGISSPGLLQVADRKSMKDGEEEEGEKKKKTRARRREGEKYDLLTVPVEKLGNEQNERGGEEERGREEVDGWRSQGEGKRERERRGGVISLPSMKFGQEIDYKTFKDLTYDIAAEREGKMKWMRPYRINPFQMALDLILTMDTGKRYIERKETETEQEFFFYQLHRERIMMKKS